MFDTNASAGKRIAVVVTTISHGDFLHVYADAFRKFSDPFNATMYVMGDVNTPPTCKTVADLLKAEGLAVIYLDIAEQLNFLKAVGFSADNISLRSDSRRNIGFLKAFADEANVIISIDDDNYPILESPFLEGHCCVGEEAALPTTICRGGWFNPCCLLKITNPVDQEILTYARGFPHSRRYEDDSSVGHSDSG